MILKTLAVGTLATNCYILGCEETHRGMVIDPGDDAEAIAASLDALGLTVEWIALTHAHFDHILAAPALRGRTGAPVAVHAAEAAWLTDPPALLRVYAPDAPAFTADRTLADGDRLEVGTLTVEVLHTPGHSPGGISLHVASEGALFCGDALFREGMGRTDLPGGEADTLPRSIRERLYGLPEETVVYPGHGPQTTIGHERSRNPWVRP